MNSNYVTEIVATYEASVFELRDQQKSTFPTLTLCGDDSQFMDTGYIIESINEIKDQLPEDCSVIAARIVADLALLNEMVSDKNALIKEENEILDEQVSELREALDAQLANIPEVKLTRAVTIGTKHMNAVELDVLEKVYQELKVTHVNHEERKDLVYYDYEQNPELREKIISTFYAILAISGVDSELDFRNYVHTEAVSGFTSELLKVVKSKR